MLDPKRTFTDGVTIARSVRDLARMARRALRSSEDIDPALVFEAIDRLQRQLEPGSSRELTRWLASLRKQLESRLALEV
jgi:hypothetical protein